MSQQNSSYDASQDLFSSDEPMETDAMSTHKPTTDNSATVETEKKKPANGPPPQSRDPKSYWHGNPLSDFNTNLHLKPIRPNHGEERHIVCIEFGKYKEGSVPVPHPPAHNGFPRDIWDSHHVRMPFSQENLFPVSSGNGKKDLQKRWKIIENTFSYPISNSVEIEKAIKEYNGSPWDFSGLHEYFEQCNDKEKDVYFNQLFPEMITILRRTPSMVTTPLPLLKQGRNCSVTLSQQQVCALLVNAFFCTYPRRSSRRNKEREHEYENYPDINFNRLFVKFFKELQPEKLKCLFAYFRRVLLGDDVPKGLVTYTRRWKRRESIPLWSKSKDKLTKLHVNSQGTIEEGEGMLQADFANSFVGGGVLGQGCVQEEIRFITCPELILSRLFTERLGDTEVLFVTGFECFSNYSGYGSSFKFMGSHKDTTKFEMTPSGPRRLSYMVAMDALHFQNPKKQYSKNNTDRELNKAYVAFSPDLEIVDDESRPVCVATGNWGCGAFRGDPQLKSLIQIMAASVVGRELVYFTFGDQKLCQSLYEMYLYLTQRSITVGYLYDLLLRYGKVVETPNWKLSLFDFLYKEIESYNVDTESEDEAEDGEKSQAENSKPAKRKLITDTAEQSETPDHLPRPTDQHQRRQGAISRQPQNFNLAYGGKKEKEFNLENMNFPDLGSDSVKQSPRRSNPDVQSEPSRGNSGGWISKTSTGNVKYNKGNAVIDKATPTDNKNISKELESEWHSMSASSSQQGTLKFDQAVKSSPKNSYSAVAKKGKTQTQEITKFFTSDKK